MRWTTTFLAAGLATLPLAAHAVTQDNFLARNTADLVALCDAPATDAMHVAAIHFCQGFMVGVYRYHQAEISGPHGRPSLFCPPQSGLTRDQVTSMFITWANKNPQYMNEQPADSLVRFGAMTWPCHK
jgi:hypothetical protein